MSTLGRPRVWVLALLLFVLHFLLHVGFSYGRGAPDLLTLALLFLARELPTGRAALAGLFLGLCEDALSVLAFGANTVAMTLLGIGGAVTRDLFVGDSRTFLLSYVFIGKWIRDLIHWIAVGEGLRQPFVEQVLIEGGIAAVYLAAIGLVVAELWGVGREAL
ncbi:MAG: rod shape-determining protein MreD [Longimicrobiales bacterium]|nr:rod shape-determining protein MreD [Longimicrobiales bacterium]